MNILVPPHPFTRFVSGIMKQADEHVAACFRENHELILNSAITETDYNKLVNGIHKLRWLIAEGSAVYEWIFLLSHTARHANFPLTILRREVTLGWLLLQNDQLESAAIAYEMASRQLEKLLVSKNAIAEWPILYEAWFDIRIGTLLMRAENHATTADVDEAHFVWEHACRQSVNHCDRRVLLALAAVQLAAGTHKGCREILDSVFNYFDLHKMNAEAGLAAFLLMRCEAMVQGIDPLDYPASGESHKWMIRAVERWRDTLQLPIGLRLLRPYATALDLDMSLSPPSIMNVRPPSAEIVYN